MRCTPAHGAALRDILHWRRDVRHFQTDRVDEVVITRLRASMDRAPSVGNARPWRVVQVKSVERRERVIENFEACNAAAAATYDGAERHAYLALKLAGLREAPVHLAVFTDTETSEGHGLGRATMPETLHYSTVMAIHTL